MPADPDRAALPVDDDLPVAIVNHGGGHSGTGWYYWDADYPEEGAVGAFETREEAEKHAREQSEYGRIEVRDGDR